MAGHNKWSKVKHIKAVVDAKKGKVFSKYSKELTIATKLGGSNPELNARLRTAIHNARAQNMPNDNIERAIKKGAGELEGSVLEEITYEGYGPGGVAFMIEVVTDNRNRSVNDIRVLLGKNHGTFADAGSVAYMFQRRGEIRIEKGNRSEDEAMELALEAGGDDLQDGDDDWIIYTAVDQLFPVVAQLEKKSISYSSAKLALVADNTITVEDLDTAKTLVKLYDVLEDYDDTQNLYTNFDFSDEVLAALD